MNTEPKVPPQWGEQPRDVRPGVVPDAPASSSSDHDAQPAGEEARRRLRWILPAATGAAGLLLGALLGLGLAVIRLPGSSPFPAALEACDVKGSSYFRLGDEGASLDIQSKGKEDPGADLADVACVLRELHIPDSVVSRLDSTRALDGRQSADWDDIEASWTFHPDSGVNLLLEISEE